MNAENYLFIERGGQTIVNGKVRYPAYLQVHITRFTAWELLETLTRQLRDRDMNPNEPVRLLIGGGEMDKATD